MNTTTCLTRDILSVWMFQRDAKIPAMKLNSHRPDLWKEDVQKSVDLFNSWFIKFAPETYQATRIVTTKNVKTALEHLGDLRAIRPALLMEHPEVLAILRMCTAPPIAKDRLIGLAQVASGLVKSLEEGRVPSRLDRGILEAQVGQICTVIARLLDDDLFPWIKSKQQPSESELVRASTIIADRLTGAVSDPLIRNAQERRQLALMEKLFLVKGYKKFTPSKGQGFLDMPALTYAFRLNIPVGENYKVNIPVDAVVKTKAKSPFPLLIEAKSAGDFTNTNKRRKEEATKVHQLKATYGPQIELLLFLCGYFDTGYLGYEAAEGIDWIWEHRIQDLEKII